MREIVLDTETTGLDPTKGHRIIEIACLELRHHVPTGNSLHVYMNPEREVPADAFRVHGITTEFLQDKPKFKEIVDDLLAFMGQDRLIIHNAAFDLKFLNFELARTRRPLISDDNTIDTLLLARRKFPGAPANLEALCRKFGVDLADRSKHGAMVDVKLLARVYLELIGGAQTVLHFSEKIRKQRIQTRVLTPRQPRTFPLTPQELADHQRLVKQIKDPLWEKIAQ